ncbi:MAG: hypothetical protein ACPG5T_05140 [Endozoicomonas sp.]
MLKLILMSAILLLTAIPLTQANTPDPTETTTAKCLVSAKHVSAISEIYSQPEGCSVKIQGKVTVAPGTLASGIGNEGFSVHDNTRGMFICTHTRLNVKHGDSVSITGKRGQIIGMPCITAETVEPLEGPPMLPTGSVPSSAIGSIISVRGTIKEIRPEAEYGTKVFIDDGSGRQVVFINKSINLTHIPELTEGVLAEIKGFVALYPAFTKDKPEIDPRSISDIRIINQ